MRLKGTYTLIKQKYFFCLLLLCLMVTSSCGNLFTGEETIFDPDRDESIREESVPVMVAFDDPYYNILSRGVGKIDPEDEWFNNKMNPVDEEGVPLDPKYKPRFFVYAFRQNNPYGYDITRKYDKNICLVDGSCGTQAEYALAHPEEMLDGHGKWAYYNGNGSFANWYFTDSDKLYYSDTEQLIPYDFFAYYHDGAITGAINRTHDLISFPVKIDGSQDLMCGVACLTDEQISVIEAIEDEEEKQKVREFYYSTYTGRRNIWPIFQMKHQMAYVKFNLIAGNAYEDAVLVNDIKLETQTEGIFVVVSRNKQVGATFTGMGLEQLPLRNIKTGEAILSGMDDSFDTDDSMEDTDQENEGIIPGDDNVDTEHLMVNTWKERNVLLERNEDGSIPPAVVAGELLIPPGNDVVLHTWLSNKDTGWEIEHTKLPLKDKVITDMGDYSIGGFVAGKTYNLNITVYGPKQISIEVIAAPWENGGDLDINTEDDRIE